MLGVTPHKQYTVTDLCKDPENTASYGGPPNLGIQIIPTLGSRVLLWAVWSRRVHVASCPGLRPISVRGQGTNFGRRGTCGTQWAGGYFSIT